MLLLTVIFSTTLHATPDSIFPEEPQSKIVWHWEEEFESKEQEKVEEWLDKVTGATEASLGAYPFELHYFIHRRDGSSEPVPWASTRRHSVQGVDFHIDPSYPLQAFIDDWTAPHEISHLSIPFLGLEHSWFAEGYASFMQYQIMQTMGICSPEQVREIYTEKIERCRPAYERDQDFVTTAKEQKSKNRYPDMYWGGASYFMQIDKQLKEQHGRTFSAFIKEYLLCCRLEDKTFEELIISWDELLGEPIFTELLHTYQTAPAFEILKQL